VEALHKGSFALPCLDAAGLHHYAPAIMVQKLHRLEVEEPANLYTVFACFEFLLSPRNPSALRDHLKRLWTRFTAVQRLAVHDFVQATVRCQEDRNAWARVVAFDASDAGEGWFDVLWPRHPIPDPVELCRVWHAAFPPDEVEPWTSLSALDPPGCYLPFAPTEWLLRLLPAYAVFVLEEPAHPSASDIRGRLDRLLHPIHGPASPRPLRGCLSVLNQAQRRAVSGLVDTLFDDDMMRDLWQRAADLEDGGPAWCDRIAPPEWEPPRRRERWLDSAYGEQERLTGTTRRRRPGVRDFSAVAAEIERAFDGVPPPGPDDRTLYDAELAYKFGVTDGHIHPPAHRGRWQDLPFAELEACGGAAVYLDAAGLHYYAPAIMIRNLHWEEWFMDAQEYTWDPQDPGLFLGLFESYGFTVSPSPGSDSGREHLRDRWARFTAPQRRALHAFLVAIGGDRDGLAGWARAVAHDESGAPGPWFDAFWPARG
ncbi:MAG: hypothetical protein ACI9MR_003265, partial [Myxococcota bacterium]